MKLARLHEGPEIFHTLQGEGVSAGQPATFIRASRCNLHCRWCDTDYTWNFVGTPWPHDLDATPGYKKHRKEDVTIEVSPAEIADIVRAMPPRRVVLTGGEPLLQQAEWLELIEILRGDGSTWTFEVETNGTQLPEPAFEAVVDQFNVSPKLANSGMAENLRLVPDVLRHFAKLPKAWFKFVAAAPSDVSEIVEITRHFEIPADQVLLMPEGRTGPELDRHAREIARACIDNGWRFSDRLHVRLWGDQRAFNLHPSATFPRRPVQPTECYCYEARIIQ